MKISIPNDIARAVMGVNGLYKKEELRDHVIKIMIREMKYIEGDSIEDAEDSFTTGE